MSRYVLKSKGLIIAEHQTTLDFPITYILHHQSEDDEDSFKIGIYCEKVLRGGIRDGNSDVPFATWSPEKGLGPISFMPYNMFEGVNLLKEMETFCERAYEAWKRGREQ